MDGIMSNHFKLSVFDYITLSTLNIGVGAFCLSLICIYTLTGKIDYTAALLPGLISYVGYTFDNISFTSEEDEFNKPKRYYFRKKFGKLCTIFAAILFLGIVAFSFSHSVSLGIGILIPEIAVVLYTVNLEKLGIPRLKRIFLFKNIFTVLVWIFVVVIIPLIYLGKCIDLSTLIVMLQMFPILFINAITCDINDIDGDIKNSIKTFPSVFGKKNTLITGLILNTLSILIYFLIFWKYRNIGSIAILSGNIYTYIYLFYYIKRKENTISNPFLDFFLIVPLITFIIQKCL